MTGAWLFVALIETSVGSGMALYGWKQRESVALGFGILLTIVPGVASEAWISALLGVGLVALFFVVRKALA